MSPSTLTYESLLAIDVGESTTRAILFDVVDEKYRYIATGSSPTTLFEPYHNVGEGTRLAIDNLQKLTGRRFLGRDEQVIVPSSSDGAGVDAVVVTMSAGDPLKVVIAGLLEDLSVDSAKRLAETTYSQIADVFSLNDHRKLEERLDAVVRLRPDLILIAGGTDGGATQSIARQIEPLRLALNLLPNEIRPQVLFAGNRNLSEQIKAAFEPLTAVEIAANIRPALEKESLEQGAAQLARLYRQARLQRLPGLQDLDNWAGGSLAPRASMFGRLIRYLGMDDISKGVLGVDVDAAATTLAGAFGGELVQMVDAGQGIRRGALSASRSPEALQEIMQWLVVDLPVEAVRDYLANKSLRPASIPITAEDLAIEQALGRYLLRKTLHKALPQITRLSPTTWGAEFLPACEPIILSGGLLSRAPALGQGLLMALDALQPTGITTVLLDQNNLTAVLGAAARVNPTLAVQVIDSGAYVNLGTVICPVFSARAGTPVLRVEVIYKNTDEEVKLDVLAGSLEVLPLSPGQVVSVKLRPLHRADIGRGPGQGGSIKRVVGGAIGLVIDARGRPLELSKDVNRRRELQKKWLWSLGS